tara:strand:- start:1965 stop:2579 length:615 start_codon:yes stop_codon:yes gene_type:complete
MNKSEQWYLDAFRESLVIPIKNEEQAKQYIQALHNANLNYHFDDDATDIIWSDYNPTWNEMKLMNERCDEMHSLKDFDAHELPCDLHRLSGFKGKLNGISYTITSCHLAPQEYRKSNPKEGEIMAHFDIFDRTLYSTFEIDSYALMMDVLEKTNVLIIVGDLSDVSVTHNWIDSTPYSCDNSTCRKEYGGDYNGGYCSDECKIE